jgi:secreted Zn-dependent insulinase-like peptidase
LRFYLCKFRKEHVIALTDEEFTQHQNSLITELSQPDLNLSKEHDKHFRTILSHEYIFNKKEILIAELKLLKKQDLEDYFKDIFYEKHRRLDVEFLSSKHEEKFDAEMEQNHKAYNELGFQRKQVKNIQEFKNINMLYPDFNKIRYANLQ